MERPSGERIAGLDFFWEVTNDTMTYLKANGNKRGQKPVKLTLDFNDPTWNLERRIEMIVDLPDNLESLEFKIPTINLLFATGWTRYMWPSALLAPGARQTVDEASASMLNGMISGFH